MNREDFIEALREQFAEEIHEAYMRCETHGEGHPGVDLKKVGDLVTKIMKSAKVQGFPEEDFKELVCTSFPEVGDYLGWRKRAA